MKLEQILDITDDYTTINIYDLNNDLLTQYDGKNSIDPKYNSHEVTRIKAGINSLEINIY